MDKKSYQFNGEANVGDVVDIGGHKYRVTGGGVKYYYHEQTGNNASERIPYFTAEEVDDV